MRDDLAVTLVTHVNNRAALAGDPLSQRANIHFIDNEWLARPIWKLSKLLRGGEKLAWTVAAAMSWPASIVFELQAHCAIVAPTVGGTVRPCPSTHAADADDRHALRRADARAVAARPAQRRLTVAQGVSRASPPRDASGSRPFGRPIGSCRITALRIDI